MYAMTLVSGAVLAVAVGAAVVADRLPAHGRGRAQLYPRVMIGCTTIWAALVIRLIVTFDAAEAVMLGAAGLMLAWGGQRRWSAHMRREQQLSNHLTRLLAANRRRRPPRA